jgi:putative transposase
MHEHLPRLAPEFYRGRAVVHWTLTVQGRETGWLSESFHLRWREIILHALPRYELLAPVYCLMPDHAHVVWMGTTEEADQKKAMKFFRTETMRWLIPHAWQRQPFDHVLRENERKRGAFAVVCQYVLENPVRKGLVERW